MAQSEGDQAVMVGSLTPSATFEIIMDTPAPTQTVEPESTSTITEIPATPTIDIQTIDCGEVFCQIQWVGVLERPINSDYRNIIDLTYPYASTRNDTLDIHHGVEFVNSSGTPVLAAQKGDVIFAGSDALTLLGPYTGFYGNVVIIRHAGLYQDRDLYTLYAHLSAVDVEVGAQVNAGEMIGRVGASGTAVGSHLHFEVRLDVNDYDHTTNPVLWFAPVIDPESGPSSSLAGVILDQAGTPVSRYQFTLERYGDNGKIEAYYYPATYYAAGVNGHPVLQENFAVSDLQPGTYRLAFIYGKLYELNFTLEPGELGFIKIQLD